MPLDRSPPPIEDVKQRLAARIARDGARTGIDAVSPHANRESGGKDPNRQMRSYRTCWLPADHPDLLPPPRDTGAYVPELAASLDNDPNLNDSARSTARKISEYVYRRDRDSRSAEITVTYLMKALRKSRRTVQRNLRQLECAGYIAVDVIHARTRMCAGLLVQLLGPLLPRHGWPEKLMKPDAPKLSQNNSSRYKTRLIPRALWAVRCTDPIRKA
jgi:hypothetical protein